MNNQKVKKYKKDSIGEFIGNLVIAMIFPFMVLWYGPKYLAKGKYVKGIIIIVIVVTEFIIVGKLRGIF